MKMFLHKVHCEHSKKKQESTHCIQVQLSQKELIIYLALLEDHWSFLLLYFISFIYKAVFCLFVINI